MKICIFTDVHWNKKSSIVTKRGAKYSQRLEYLIKGMNWVNDLAIKQACGAMVCCGDFFDKDIVNDEEITALKEIAWNELPKYFVCGNHESSTMDLQFSTLNVLGLGEKNHFIIDEPCITPIDAFNPNLYFCFLPYITESDRKPLESYFKLKEDNKYVLFSHIDIQGINYGGFVSKIGFPYEDLSKQFELTLNGHLHNQVFITKNVLNLGSLSAHNFTNDSLNYKYGAWVLDTDTLKLEFFENPYSLNFYKFDVLKEEDLAILKGVKDNAVLSVRCAASLTEKAKEVLASLSDKIVESRIVLVQAALDTDAITLDIKDLAINHIAEFEKCCRQSIENTDVLEQELAEICK